MDAGKVIGTDGRTTYGDTPRAIAKRLDATHADVIGLNCSTGPDLMRDPIRFLGENATLPVSCIPNAGLPLNVDGEAVYPLEPEPFAALLAEQGYGAAGRRSRRSRASRRRRPGGSSGSCPSS